MKLLDRYRERRYGPLTRDRCETCGRQLRERERVEIVEAHSDPDGMGGWMMSAAYCKAHEPRTTP